MGRQDGWGRAAGGGADPVDAGKLLGGGRLPGQNHPHIPAAALAAKITDDDPEGGGAQKPCQGPCMQPSRAAADQAVEDDGLLALGCLIKVAAGRCPILVGCSGIRCPPEARRCRVPVRADRLQGTGEEGVMEISSELERRKNKIGIGVESGSCSMAGSGPPEG